MCATRIDHHVLIESNSTSDWLPLELRLQEAGFTTELAACPSPVDQLHNPDAIIIDHPVSARAGLDYCREVISSTGKTGIPLILTISPDESEIIPLLSDDDPIDVIFKPVDPGMLVHRLRRLLQRNEATIPGKNLEEELHTLKVAIDSLPIGITLSDPDGNIVYSNLAEASIHGYTVKELVGRSTACFAKPGMHNPVGKSALEEIGAWKRESINVRKDGSEFPVHLTSIAVRSAGRCMGIVTTCEDISERKDTERQIYQLAHMDSLTGLPNRRLLQDRLRHAMALARREGGKVCLFYLDLDNFKLINDSQGHDFGDKLLQNVANRLSAMMRESDTLARLGGDEFVVIMVSVKGQDSFTTTAQRILSVFYHPFDIDGRRIYTSASIGISIFPNDGIDGDLLLKCADSAMYQVKQEGRSGFRFFSAELNEQISRRVEMENALHSALANDEFILLYLPSWSGRDKRIKGAEALLRWQSDRFGLMMPGDFIPMLEDSGLIFCIGEWILRTACEQAKKWSSSGMKDLLVSVNISGKQLGQPDFLAVVARILRDSGVDPSCIELEFTESSVMESAEKTMETLHMLKAIGFQLSIDNFGKGYSCLNYLKHFPIDSIKIDRSFIANITPDGEDAAIVRAMISIASVLNMGVVAEGVETESQLDCLLSLGCRDMQGYLMGEPMSAGELERLVIG